MDEQGGHIAVLAEQVLELLDPKAGQVVLDCTVGRGGHAAAIAAHLEPGGRYVGLDVDPANVEYVRQRLADAPIQTDLICTNFVQARSVLDELHITRVDAVLADLGFASTQMADPGRGLSFAVDGPLDMRLDPALPHTAADLLSDLCEHELADLIYRFGEERHSRKIARKIVEQREQSPIKTTAVLAELVRRAYPPRRSKRRGATIDPATRTFMALRIAVNHELAALEQLLDDLPKLLTPGGAAAIISFHSLEDRLVKHAFATLAKQGRARLLNRKPRIADAPQRTANPRSRSAKLRVMRLECARTEATE